MLHGLAPWGGSYIGKYTWPLNKVGAADNFLKVLLLFSFGPLPSGVSKWTTHACCPLVGPSSQLILPVVSLQTTALSILAALLAPLCAWAKNVSSDLLGRAHHLNAQNTDNLDL